MNSNGNLFILFEAFNEFNDDELKCKLFILFDAFM